MTRDSTPISTQIIERLDTEGLSWESYRLYDVIDPVALDRLMDSNHGDVEVTFTVHDYQVTVTGPGSIQVNRLPTQ